MIQLLSGQTLRLWALLLLFFSGITLASAQTLITNQTYGYTEFFEVINNVNDSEVYFEDIRLEFDPVNDQRFFIPFGDFPTYAAEDTITVNKDVFINRVTLDVFDGPGGHVYAFPYIHWEGVVEWSEVQAGRFIFYRNRFDGPVYFHQPEQNFRTPHVQFKQNHFASLLEIVSSNRNTDWVLINQNRFKTDENIPLALVIYDDPAEYIGIEHNEFSTHSEEVDPILYLQLQARNTFSMAGNRFGVNVGFSNTNITGSAIIRNNIFEKYLGIHGSLFNRHATRLEWEDFGKRLAFLNYPVMPGFVEDWEIGPVKLDRPEDFAHPTAYRAMIPAYRMIHEIFLASEPRRIANEAYVALKEIEKNETEFYYRNNPGFAAYFDWQLFRFIHVFSDYGTRPAKGIVISLYVILFFSLIYFLFPNTWDTISKDKIRNRIEFFVTYYQDEQKMADIYADKNRDKMSSYQRFKERLAEIKGKVPGSVVFMGRPVYMLSVGNYKLTHAFLTRVDSLKARWGNQTRTGRALNGTFITVGLAGLIFYDLFLKLLNAVILSINTFTTLGFGDIPTSGIPRYMAVIEGFVGWFMLTFFSVSLIWQVLN